MENDLDHPARQRIGVLTSELTLALFLRQGNFWNQVAMIREGLQITPTCRLPPQCDGDASSLLASARDTAPTTNPATAAGAWRMILALLHDRCISPSHAIGEAEASRRAWSFFLVSCLLYDPPDDRLIEFAQCGTTSVLTVISASDQRSSSLGTMSADAGSADPSGSPLSLRPAGPLPTTFGATIVAHRDTEAIVSDLLHYWIAFLRELDQRYLQPHGLAYEEIKRDLDERVPSVTNWHNYPSELAIVVTADTSRSDLLRAFHAIPPAQGASRKATRRRVDPLAALQCAIWHDDYKLTYPEIADKMGWTRSEDEYQNPRRSETARRYVKHGRRLRDQQKPAT